MKDLSILVVTHHRVRQCVACIASLVKAVRETPHLSFEILVGINGEDSETEGLVAELGKFQTKVKVIRSAREQTPSSLRNLLLKEAIGTWTYFIDDDAFVEPEIFKKFLLARQEQPDSIALGGPNLTPPQSSVFQNVTGSAMASRFATHFSAVRYRVSGSNRPCGEESLILCNLFVKNSVLGEDPFPEDFLCCEENWLLQNLKKKGHKLTYCPYLAVWHERRSDLLSFVGQIFRYGFGRGQILKRRPMGVRFAHLLPTVALIYGAILFFASWFYKISFGWMVPFFAYLFCSIVAATLKFGGNQKSLSTFIYSYSLFPIIHTSYACGLLMGLIKG